MEEGHTTEHTSEGWFSGACTLALKLQLRLDILLQRSDGHVHACVQGGDFGVKKRVGVKYYTGVCVRHIVQLVGNTFVMQAHTIGQHAVCKSEIEGSGGR